MRKVGWQWKIILFLMFAGLFCPVKVHAEETGSYLSELSDEMDYGKLDTFLENYGVEQVLMKKRRISSRMFCLQQICTGLKAMECREW